jgi:hypothetical protein
MSCWIFKKKLLTFVEIVENWALVSTIRLLLLQIHNSQGVLLACLFFSFVKIWKIKNWKCWTLFYKLNKYLTKKCQLPIGGIIFWCIADPFLKIHDFKNLSMTFLNLLSRMICLSKLWKTYELEIIEFILKWSSL